MFGEDRCTGANYRGGMWITWESMFGSGSYTPGSVLPQPAMLDAGENIPCRPASGLHVGGAASEAAEICGGATVSESEADNGYVASATGVGDVVDGDQLADSRARRE